MLQVGETYQLWKGMKWLSLNFYEVHLFFYNLIPCLWNQIALLSYGMQ